jgi:tape measure domain-containing protein
MARDISIAISARDNFTQAITTMRNANQSFNKDLEGLSSKLKALNDTKITLKADTDKARQALREAQKAFDLCGDAAHEAAMKAANADYEQARRNFKLVGDEARNTEKAILDMTDAHSRMSNRVGSSGSGTESLMGRLGAAGARKMVADAAGEFANASITSMFGEPAGNAIASIVSGAAGGAAMGSIAGAPGVAVGAGIGAVAGGINAATQVFQAEDEAFKSVVQEQVNAQLTRQQEDLAAGSTIASGRETSLQSFTTLFGDEETAKNYLEDMKDMANTTPFLYDDLAQMSKVLKTYGYSPDEMLPQLTTIGDAGAALGMSAADMSMVATGLGRMKSSGKTSLEYINILQERGIDAIGYLAEKKGVDKGTVYEKISKNLIDGAWAAQVISEAMGEDFAGSMEAQSKTFAGLSSTLQGMNEEMQNAMGEGYNEERKKGIQAQIDYLGGENGEKMSEANRLIGEYKASLENQREQMLRDAESEALERIERDGLTGAEAGKVLAEARIQAEADYMNSEGAQQEIELQKSLVASARQSLSEDDVYKNFGYEMGKEYTKGIAAAIGEGLVQELSPEEIDALSTGGWGYESVFKDSQGNLSNHAYGLPYVPRDDYLARLHEGEMVLTASQAHAYREGGAPVSVQMNGATIREEADIYKIAQALAEELRRAQQVS